jgi:hypothetical protein
MTAGLAFAAAYLAFSPATPNFSLLVPIAPIVGVTGFIFSLGFWTTEAPLRALVGIFVLPFLCGFYFLVTFFVTGRGAVPGGLLALLGVASLALTFMGGKSSS